MSMRQKMVRQIEVHQNDQVCRRVLVKVIQNL
jgi:hypothetical protein